MKHALGHLDTWTPAAAEAPPGETRASKLGPGFRLQPLHPQPCPPGHDPDPRCCLLRVRVDRLPLALAG